MDRHFKKAFMLALVLLILSLIGCSSNAEKNNRAMGSKAGSNSETAAQTVTFAITGPKEDHSADRAASPVKIKNGDTVLDVLLAAEGKGNVDYSGSGAAAYVSGIHNINEFDYGAKSGWVFKLNGVSLNQSIGSVAVKNGDKVECLYTE